MRRAAPDCRPRASPLPCADVLLNQPLRLSSYVTDMYGGVAMFDVDGAPVSPGALQGSFTNPCELERGCC